MCHGTDNKLCQSCYRKTAKPNHYMQSYFATPKIKDGECKYKITQNQ